MKEGYLDRARCVMINSLLQNTVESVESIYALDGKDADVCEALCQILCNMIVLMETTGVAHLSAHKTARDLLNKITE